MDKSILDMISRLKLAATLQERERISIDLETAVRMAPAMAAKLETRLWDIGDIVNLIEAMELAEA